jgi:hypothetical protein
MSCSKNIYTLLYLLLLLLLDSWQAKGLAQPTADGLPQTIVLALVPGQEADPGLYVVVDLEDDVVGLGDLAAGVGDLVLWLLVLELEQAAALVDGLAGGALAQLLEGGGANVGQVVRRGARDDGVPDDGAVGLVLLVRGRPLGRHVDEELLGVPGEERREVRVERELDDGVLLLLGRVVVRSSLDSVGKETVKVSKVSTEQTKEKKHRADYMPSRFARRLLLECQYGSRCERRQRGNP